MSPEAEVCDGFTKKVPFGCGNLYLTINEENNRPTQVFLRVGKAGNCQHALLEGVGRLVSVMLDNKMPLELIHHTICAIRCDKGIAGAGRLSCLDALANALQKYIVEAPGPQP